MDVIVIGGGIAGIVTAYELHAAGHRVCVIERHATVAQGATYGQGGALLPSPLDVWFGPTFMASSRAKQSGMIAKTAFDGTARDFLKQLARLRDPEAFAAQYALLQPLVELSRRALGLIETQRELDYEQRVGMLHVFRHARELDEAQPAIDLLKRFGVAHRVLSPEQCVEAEPSVPDDPAFAGGVLLPAERTGNCPLLTKQLKQLLEDGGVQFRMSRQVAALQLDERRAAVQLASVGVGDERKRAADVEVISADAVVVAAGAGTPALVGGFASTPSLHPLRVHTLTAPVAYEERAPHVTVVDSVKRITMTRVNQRLRVGGAGVFRASRKPTSPLTRPRAPRLRSARPGHARLDSGRRARVGGAFVGRRAPAFGGRLAGGRRDAASAPFRQCGARSGRLGLACGSAKVVADLVSGLTPDIPADTLAALRIDRF